MSELNKIKSNPKATTVIKNIHFDWESPELTLTSPSQGGAASGKNNAYLFKAAKAHEKDLDSEQRAILKEIGEEFTPLEKSKEGNNKTPSSSSEGLDGEDDNKDINKGEDEIMSEDTLERITQLEKALAVSEAVNSLSGYGFEADLNKAVAGAIANLEDQADKDAITKAFDTLVEDKEKEVEKAKKGKGKGKEYEEGENALAKELGEEAGAEGEVEGSEVEKSLAERVADYQEKINKGELQ